MSLGKHKYYCEMCRKQCKDDNAFQQHKRSGFHQQNMINFNEDPAFFINRFSTEVRNKFIEVCRTKYGHHGFVPANRAYNEYIRDPYHTHLNSTKWASLSEFMTELEQDGVVELGKEVDASGTEQIMMRLIDTEKDKKDALAQHMSKDSIREQERKREQKDMEKIIKQANKLQAKTLGDRPRVEEEKKGPSIIQFETSSFQIGFSKEEPVMQQETKKRIGSIFGDTSNDKIELTSLLKGKKSNLEKILEHSSTQIKEIPKTEWVKVGLIVKIRKDGPYNKAKGEVVKIITPSRVIVRIENRENEFDEKDLSKVLPGEGGRVYLFSKGQIATVVNIDMKTQLVTARRGDADGNKEIFKVKFDDLCKINS